MVKAAPDVLQPQQGIKRYFAVQTYCFKRLGIDITSTERTIFSPFLVSIPGFILFALCFPIIIYAAQYKNDLNLVTDAISPCWQTVLAILKLWYFLWNKKKVILLIRKIWLHNLEARDGELEIVADENRKEARYSSLFFFTVHNACSWALISPMIIASYYKLKGFAFMDNLDPPLKAAYFIDLKTNFGYSFAYVWDIISLYVVTYSSVGVDTLYCWLAHNIAAQFRRVNLRFKLASDALQANRLNEDEFVQSLGSCIKYHNYVIDLADTFNDVYMVTVFMQFTISFLQIACIVFQVSRGGEIAKILFQMAFLLSASVQLILYCHGGQRIIDESKSVSAAVYNCFKWHNLSTKSKKILILPIMRAQKSCTLTGIFFVADYALFLWVYRTACSYVTMFMAMES